ncbi:MAG: CocE/NonD family hydrolase [Deltaproteobacteria bacterium]|nr:CocE/NonD family hydrolase [Deltaproteobacteria bacterium]
MTPARLVLPTILSALTCLCLSATLVGSTAPNDEDAAFIRQHFDKAEFRIPMRDGARLHTVVYTPRDTSQVYPILLLRTPYSAGPYGPGEYKVKDLNWYINLVREGYIFVFQDVRGRYLSEGTWTNMTPHIADKRDSTDVDESSDTYDTIAWLVDHVPRNNGRAGLLGISYRGLYAAAGAIDAHPALKAVSPQGPMSDIYFDDFHHMGAFSIGYFNGMPTFGTHRPALTTKSWWSGIDYGTRPRDDYELFMRFGSLESEGQRYLPDNFLWQEIVAHPDHDAFWQARNILPHLRDITPAVMTVGGLFDAEDLYGSFNVYKAIERQSPPDATNILVMGPWFHGAWSRADGSSRGHVYFGEGNSTFYQEEVEVPFFNYHLKDQGSGDLPEALVFETGANRWRRFDQWPPAAAPPGRLYLGRGGGLSVEPPGGSGFVEYVSDPQRPVPFTDGRNYMTDDQRFASRRPDVAVFQSAPLEDSLTLAGPVQATLYVSTSQTAADWVVKLIDVYPDDHPAYPHEPDRQLGGYQQMVRSEAMRGRYRNSFSRPEPFEPHRVTEVGVTLQDVLHTFKPGHRVMVHVQSTCFPLIDRNPQVYVDNIYRADPRTFVRAVHRVFCSAAHPSHLKVGLLRD